MSGKTHRYQAFDSLRSIAALIVLLIHAQILFGFSIPRLPWPFSGLFDSKAAVVFFFVLSGFVLHLSFSKTPLSLVSFVGFQVRRVLRIYPLYYLSLLAVVAAVYMQDRSAFPHFAGDGGGATNVLKANHRDVAQWLQQLLLVGPGFDMYFFKSASLDFGRGDASGNCFPILLMGDFQLESCEGHNVCRRQFVLGSYHGKLTHLGFLELIPLFLMGAFFAQHRNAILNATTSRGQIFAIGVFSLALYSSRTRMGILSSLGWYGCGLGSLGFLWVALRSTTLAGFLLRPVLIFLGELSYGIYILHFSVLLALSTQASKFDSQGMIILFVISLLLTVGISLLCYRLFENPFIDLGRNLSEKLKGSAKGADNSPKPNATEISAP